MQALGSPPSAFPGTLVLGFTCCAILLALYTSLFLHPNTDTPTLETQYAGFCMPYLFRLVCSHLPTCFMLIHNLLCAYQVHSDFFPEASVVIPQVKSPPAVQASQKFKSWLVHFQFSSLLRYLRGQWRMAQELGLLLPMWESQMQF